MRYYRIVQEELEGARYIYRVQVRGWFRWRDVRVVYDTDSSGAALTKVLRFDAPGEALRWITDRMGRNEGLKTVIGTYAVHG